MARRGRDAVLLVDDDSEWREILAEHLESAGFRVAVASDGFVAWMSFLRSEPLVVVTDVHMPVMDGRELLARVRSRNFRVPVVLVTACDALDRTAELSDAYRVIAKPADPDGIIAAVRAAIAHRTSQTALGRLWAAAASIPRPAEPPGVGRSALRWVSARRRQVVAVSAIICVLMAAVFATRPAARRLR